RVWIVHQSLDSPEYHTCDDTDCDIRTDHSIKYVGSYFTGLHQNSSFQRAQRVYCNREARIQECIDTVTYGRWSANFTFTWRSSIDCNVFQFAVYGIVDY